MFKINKKLLVVFLLIAALGAAGYFFKDKAINYILGYSDIKEPISGVFSNVQNVAKEVFTPPPLMGKQDSGAGTLSKEGVIELTNARRAENNLPPLEENTKLNYAAVEKLNDMFNNQYFAHVSPDNLGVSHWAGDAGYDYLVIGENLALGNFADDADLVQAWMNSEGHRENILNEKYTDIGVAVGEGIFEGKKTWLAVQEFGRPISDCPQPDGELKLKIEAYERNISQTESSLNLLKIQVESIKPQRSALKNSYNELVDKYNALVVQYNSLVEEVKKMVDEYNGEVRNFNSCVNNL